MFETGASLERVYTQKSDLWQVGKLMESWESEAGRSLGPRGTQLKQDLLSKKKMTVDYL